MSMKEYLHVKGVRYKQWRGGACGENVGAE